MERIIGICVGNALLGSRHAFYGDDNVTRNGIYARFQDGTLHLFIAIKRQAAIENKQLSASKADSARQTTGALVFQGTSPGKG